MESQARRIWCGALSWVRRALHCTRRPALLRLKRPGRRSVKTSKTYDACRVSRTVPNEDLEQEEEIGREDRGEEEVGKGEGEWQEEGWRKEEEDMARRRVLEQG